VLIAGNRDDGPPFIADIDHGVVVAVRVLNALRITSPSVGGPVDEHRTPAER
jgi:hypothetical protein